MVKEKITYKFVENKKPTNRMCMWWVWECYGDSIDVEGNQWMCQCLQNSNNDPTWNYRYARYIYDRDSSTCKSYKSLKTLYKNHLSDVI